MRSEKEGNGSKKKHEFTHVHVREEGMLAEEANEEQFAHDVDDIEKGLRAIYKGNDKDLSIVTKAEGGLTRLLAKVILFLLTLLVGGICTFLAWNWWKNTNSTGDAVDVAIVAPISVKSGEEVNVEITYKNPRSIALAQLSLDINIPRGFELSSSSPPPTNDEQLVWNVGTLGQHSDGKIILTGRWYAEVPEDDRVQVVTTYRPANFNADFSTITTAEVAVHESTLSVALVGPEKATVGEQVSYVAMFTNNGLFAQEAEGEFMLPEGFVPLSWTPELPPGQGTVWSLGNIEPGASVTQTVVGSYASEVNDLQEMKVKNTVKTAQGENYTQGSATWLTDVEGGALSVVLAGNGSTSTVSVTPGDQLRLSVQLANISDADVSDAQILLDFQPETGIPISWSEANVGKAKITSAGILLATADIGTITSTERKTFSFTFPLKAEIGASQASAFTVSAFVTSGGVTVQSLPLTISLNANVSLSAAARYYDTSGAPLGSGPFPPHAGEETTFVLDWSFNRTLHGLRDVTVTATIPQNIRFQAVRSVAIGSVSYNETTRTLTWSMSEIPADISTGNAQVEIAYTPSDADVEEYGKLLSGSILRGEDEITSAVVTAEAAEVTTEMPEDTIAAGKGIVQQ